MTAKTKAFRRRAIGVYQNATGSETGQGWQTWFARQVRVHSTTVWRWANGRSRIPSSALLLLERMEQDYTRKRSEA